MIWRQAGLQPVPPWYIFEIIINMCLFAVHVGNRNGWIFSRSLFHFLFGMVLSQHPLCQYHWLALSKHNITHTQTCTRPASCTHKLFVSYTQQMHVFPTEQLENVSLFRFNMEPYTQKWCAVTFEQSENRHTGEEQRWAALKNTPNLTLPEWMIQIGANLDSHRVRDSAPSPSFPRKGNLLEFEPGQNNYKMFLLLCH